MSLGINTRITDTREQPYTLSRGKTLYVGGSGDGNYTKIQDAIEDADDGDTVFVFNGIYYENIIINKCINLIGENKETAIIDGMKNDSVVVFDKCTSTIRSFSIRNGSSIHRLARGILIYPFSNQSMIDNCIIFNCTYGIEIMDSKDVQILNCNIFDNLEGIMLSDAPYCWISDCVLSNRQGNINVHSENNNIINCIITGDSGTIWSVGVDIYSNNNNVIECDISTNGDGICIHESSYYTGDNNLIENCILSGNKGRGITISTSNNKIKNTIVSNNGYNDFDEDYGIEIFDGSNNIIECCQISNNCKGGVWICWTAWSNYIIKSTIEKNGYGWEFGSGINCYSGNYIYLNNFIDNREQAYACDFGNYWDNGELGNYWDDYREKYPNARRIWSKGIWNTPYDIPGGDNQNKDNYPLIKPWKKSKPRTIQNDIASYSSYLLRFLEQFPILHRVLSLIRV